MKKINPWLLLDCSALIFYPYSIYSMYQKGGLVGNTLAMVGVVMLSIYVYFMTRPKGDSGNV